MYWKTDLHNLFNFLRLRKDGHAQKEIRVYADAMGDITSSVVPNAYEAFEDYRLESTKFSRLEMSVLGDLLETRADIPENISKIENDIKESKARKDSGVNYMGFNWDSTELQEFADKLKKNG